MIFGGTNLKRQESLRAQHIESRSGDLMYSHLVSPMRHAEAVVPG